MSEEQEREIESLFREYECCRDTAWGAICEVFFARGMTFAAKGRVGYEPDGPVGMALNWLKVALACPTFRWDIDQHEIATNTLADAELALTSAPGAGEAGAEPELEEEIGRLQTALAFWLPNVPDEGHPLYDRIANDAFLLLGLIGPDDEKCAQDKGYVTLAPGAAPHAVGTYADGYRKGWADHLALTATPSEKLDSDWKELRDIAKFFEERRDGLNSAFLRKCADRMEQLEAGSKA